MKKVLLVIVIALIVFVILIYISVSGPVKEHKTYEIDGVEDLSDIDFKDHDSIQIAASTLYRGNSLKKLMQGGNYREAWATPIKVPVVFLDTLKGGMKILKEGGGKQTHSLRLKADNDVVYTLRSINKDPKPLVPEFARTLGIENIVIDGVSAQHPYAAIVVAALAEEIDVLHTNPQVVFVPEQSSLGKYNNKYGNRLYLLEYETKGKKNWTTYKDVDKIIDTDNLQKLEMKHEDKVSIDKRALVRARLFDLLIGDWDRHAKQWGWVVQKKEDHYYAIPLPGDRDNAFFKISGLVPTIITNQNITPELRPFQKEIDYLPGLVMPFDVYFLRSVALEIFIEEAEFIQLQLTNESIDKALKVWPSSFYDLDGKEIATKIKIRRNDLKDYAKRFKEVLDEKEVLREPLKGSEDIDLSENLIKCFDC